MDFSEKLVELRRRRGYSQEQLADLLDVSRQAVGKWESGQSMPDLNKLIALADLFDLSLDDLVRSKTNLGEDEVTAASAQRPIYQVMPVGYEYKSKRSLFGLPLVHINFGYGSLRCAKGIFALGNTAVGVVAIGGAAAGGLAFGGVSLGVFALGGLAIGGVCFGGFALGLFAVGGAAIGIYAIGGGAFACGVAAGGSAFGPVSIGANRSAGYLLTDQTTADAIGHYLDSVRPELWPFLRNIFIGFY